MIRESVTIQDVIDYLNKMLQVDPDLMAMFVNTRFDLNKPLDDYPQEIQVMQSAKPALGIIGLLNGLFGTIEDGPQKGWGPLMIAMDKSNHFILHEFVRTEAYMKKHEDAIV